MKRGEIWTIQSDGYASKPRLLVVLQSDNTTFDSVIRCLLTSFNSEGIPTRVKVEPTQNNGLAKPSYVMTEKIVAVDKNLLGQRIGKLEKKTMDAVSKQLAIVLGL